MIEITGPILKENRNPFRKFPVSSLLAILTAAVFFLQLSEQGTENFSLSLITVSLQVAFIASVAAYYVCHPSGISETACHAVSLVSGLVFFALGWIVVPHSLYMLVIGGFAALLIAISPIFYKASQDELWKHVVWGVIAAFLGLVVFVFWCSAFYTIQWMAHTLFLVDTGLGRIREVIIGLGIVLSLLFFLAWLPPTTRESDDKINAALFVYLRPIFDFLVVPIIFIIGIILHAYAALILLRQTFPDGQVGRMVTAYVCFVLAVRFVIHPFLPEGRMLTRLFGQIWALLLMVPLALLLFAVTMRSSQYGMTINRYYLYALAVAALCIMGAQIFKRWRNDIRVVPVVPAFCLIISVFGPWSVQNWVGYSQAQYLIRNFVQAGRLVFSDVRLYDEKYNDIVRHVTLLDETEQLSRLLPYVQKDNRVAITFITPNKLRPDDRPSAEEFMQALGVQPLHVGQEGGISVNSPRDTLVFADQYLNRGGVFKIGTFDIVVPYVFVTRKVVEVDINNLTFINMRIDGERVLLTFKNLADSISTKELTTLAASGSMRRHSIRPVDLKTNGGRHLRIIPLEIILDAEGIPQSMSLSIMLQEKEWLR